jgi:flavin reductase
MTVRRQEYRAGTVRFGGAVNIITMDGAAGRSGMTASAVVSVTDDPSASFRSLNDSDTASDQRQDEY